MALTFETEFFFKAKPLQVFKALSDLDALPGIIPEITRIERLTGDGFAAGTRWRETRKMFGREASEVFEVISCEPPRTMVLRVDGAQGTSGSGEYVFSYELTPRDGGASLKLTARMEMRGFFKNLIGKLFLGQFRKAAEKDVEKLRDWVERQGQPA
ncbi:MAG: hypothetical protein GMKNLPBB_01569 [Myxococcota bacterium]|nr:hypothetical protein [Myxococcota bacterium]